jgi:hypothetical protein
LGNDLSAWAAAWPDAPAYRLELTEILHRHLDDGMTLPRKD